MSAAAVLRLENIPAERPATRVVLRTEAELDQHMRAIDRLNRRPNGSVFTDGTLLKYAFKDALEREQNPFVIAIYGDRAGLLALIPLYYSSRKTLQLLWDKVSDYVDVLAAEEAWDYVRAELRGLLRHGLSFCFNNVRSDSTLAEIVNEFRAPLQMVQRETLEHAWAISKLKGAPRLNRGDVKRRQSQLQKRGVRVEYIGGEEVDERIREAILEIVYLKHVEFASRKRAYELKLSLADFIELVSLLVKQGKAFIARAVDREALVEAAILFFRDSRSVYSMLPAYNLYAPHSPGLSLMYHTIGDFLAEKSGPVIYDFTLGDEAYKQRFANEKISIRRIYLSDRAVKRFTAFVECRLLDQIKRHEPVNRLKILLMNQFLELKFVARRFVSKARDYAAGGLLAALKRKLRNKMAAVIILRRESGDTDQISSATNEGFQFSVARFPQLIDFYSRSISSRYEVLDKTRTSLCWLAHHFVPYGLFTEGKLVSLVWLQLSGKYIIGEKHFEIDLKEDECAELDGMTNPRYRRRGFFSLLQKNILKTEAVRNKKMLLHITANNIPSIKAHRKLGFVEVDRIR